MKLKLGDGLNIPIEMAGQAVALVGIRGSGKTNTGGVIAEELLDHGQQVVVIDPTDAWWGLRSKYPVFIFGGPHGDLELTENDGKTLAEFVVQERVPIILSLRHLRKGAQRRLITEFCEELYHLKGKTEYRTPLTVFIDEAPQFIPQRVIGEMARLVGAVQDMILLGRSVGFGVVMISQRFATLNADVRTQADTVIVHRLPSPLDRKALNEWIEENATIAEQKEVLSSLATLKTGEAWVWAPYFDLFKRQQIRARRTFDSSAAPKRGAAPAVPKDLTKIDIEKLKGKMASAIETAKANNPAELKKQLAAKDKQIKELEANRAKATPNIPANIPTAKPVPALTDADRALIQKVVVTLDHVQSTLTEKFAKADDSLRKDAESIALVYVETIRRMALNASEDVKDLLEKASVKKLLEKLNGLAVTPAPVVNRAANYSGNITRTPQPPKAQQVNRGAPRTLIQIGDVRVSGPQQRILNALAWADQVNLAPLDKTHCALLADSSPTSSTYANNLGALRSAGLIDYPQPGRVALTEAGSAIATLEDVPATDEGLQQQIFSKVSGPQTAILKALIAAYPEPIEKAQLAELANASATSSTYANNLGSLRSLGLLDYPRQGFVVAKPVLFLEGR